MTKKKRSQRHIHDAPVNNLKKINIPYWILPLILFATFLAFIPALKAGFVTWDDGGYIHDNPLIRDLSNLKLMLTTPVAGNYHPLTIFSLAINYAISGMEAWSYHLFNLLLHLVNCFLVFRLVLLLSKRNIVIAFTTAVLFGIHPMHVESVAWVSARKDVLYGLFFIAGLITYTKYADSGSRKQYGLAILFFLLSLLSKPAAVIFPIVLFCVDLLRKRKLSYKTVIEKIPFFAFALLGGLLTIYAQKSVGATGLDVFSFGSRILFGFYGIMMYFIKMILPLNLSPFYPLPPFNQDLPQEYFLAPFFFIGLAILFFYTLKKIRPVAFGILFYLVNLLLVVQFFSVGSAIIADRYTYIPYIGLFYALGFLIDRYAKSRLNKASIIIIPVTILLGIVTYKQASVWKDSASLWDQAIKSRPSVKAYFNRAESYREESNYILAIEHYNKAIELRSLDIESYTNRGNTYFFQNKLDLALQDFNKALSINPDFVPALENMGSLLGTQGHFDSALIYFDRAIVLDPGYKSAYYNRGVANMELNKNENALVDFEKYLKFQPNHAKTFNFIGVCQQRLGKYQESINNITKAIAIDPNPVFYLNRSYAYNAFKNMEQAKKDALTARQGGAKIPDEYATSLGIQ